MKNIKDMKKGIEVTIMSFLLISVLVITTVTVKKSPDLFCHFISWLGECEETDEICTKK